MGKRSFSWLRLKTNINFLLEIKQVVKSSSNVVMKVQSVLEFSGADETIVLCHLALGMLADAWKFPTFVLNTAVNMSVRPLVIQSQHLEAP